MTIKTLLTGALLLGALAMTTPAHANGGGGLRPAPPTLERFAGPWGAHGAALHVNVQAHSAEISMRTYAWCGPGVSSPCDRITNHGIVAGLDVRLTITALRGDTAIGSVVGSTNLRDLPLRSYVGLVLLPHGRLYIDDPRDVVSRVLCGPGSLSARPPAFPAVALCGA
jgi:hypothetical protein